MFLLWPRQLPWCGDQTPTSFPHSPSAGPVLLTVFFPQVPLSYRVLCGSIYSFLVVRYSCPFSAGVLHALLCLKVDSRRICGERCIPCPPTPPPSVLPALWEHLSYSTIINLWAHIHLPLHCELFKEKVQTFFISVSPAPKNACYTDNEK